MTNSGKDDKPIFEKLHKERYIKKELFSRDAGKNYVFKLMLKFLFSKN